ncbi:MAG: Lrp/AsnC family transcriptional regulator [Clostridium sp.]
MKLDDLDILILKELNENSKLTFKEIGEKLHLTGQAVGNRVNKLIDNTIIQNFTININKEEIGLSNISYIRIYMKDNSHEKALRLINSYDEITEAYRIGSDCCYLLKLEAETNTILNKVLDEILPFANYETSIVLNRIK